MRTSSEQRKHINAFNEKIKKRKIAFETIDCLCGSKEFGDIANKDRYELIQKTVICKKCGLIQSNPRMTEKQYENFYVSDDYRRCYESGNYLEIYQNFYKKEFGKHIFDAVVRVKPNVKSVLEIGAGGGWNLLPFIEAGIPVKGYEYSQSLVDMGRSRQIADLYRGGVDEVRGKYDVIILNHVLEHFTDPIREIRKIAEYLNDDGMIYVAVPDMANFNRDQLQNAHTYYFNKKTLEYYLSKVGLKMIHSEPAEGIHLAAIFKKIEGMLPFDFLEGNYQEQLEIIKKGLKVKLLVKIKRFIYRVINKMFDR